MSTAIQALADRIKICILNQGVWNSVRNHKAETRQEQSRHGTQRIKSVDIVLAEDENLKQALTIKGKIYTEHRRLTMPSPCDGMRIVPLSREFEHSSTLGGLIYEFNKSVKKFIDNWDDVVITAKNELNGLFDASMFPTQEELQRRFYNNIRYMSCPHDGDWAGWLDETMKVGRLELQQRIIDAARNLADVCSKDGRVFESTLDKLQDICELSGDFNLMDDPIISKASKELSIITREYNVEDLRKNDAIKRDVANRTNQILATLKLS